MARNESSWFDTEIYAYIYVSEQLMDNISGLTGVVNQFRIYFADTADEGATLDTLLKTEGLNATSSELFEGSAVDKQIKAGIEGKKAVVTYLPVLSH